MRARTAVKPELNPARPHNHFLQPWSGPMERVFEAVSPGVFGAAFAKPSSLSNSNPSRLSACCVPLRFAAEQNPSSGFPSVLSGILFRTNLSPLPSAALHCTASAMLSSAVSPHSIPIGPTSAATTGGFLLTASVIRVQRPRCKVDHLAGYPTVVQIPSIRSPWFGLTSKKHDRAE